MNFRNGKILMTCLLHHIRQTRKLKMESTFETHHFTFSRPSSFSEKCGVMCCNVTCYRQSTVCKQKLCLAQLQDTQRTFDTGYMMMNPNKEQHSVNEFMDLDFFI